MDDHAEESGEMINDDCDKWASVTPSEPKPGSMKYEPTKEQYYTSPILSVCYSIGLTEGQTIEMLWRAHERLLREHMRLVSLQPIRMSFPADSRSADPVKR
jgi:hypothetical protein